MVDVETDETEAVAAVLGDDDDDAGCLFDLCSVNGYQRFATRVLVAWR